MKASVFTQKLKLPSYSYKKLKKDKNCNLTVSCKEKNLRPSFCGSLK